MRFAGELTRKYGCAVDVALHEPNREGDKRNWHAHLLATTRKVNAGTLAEKCEIELSDAKRLSLGLAPARIEVESVRQMWAEEVNRQLSQSHRPERVDHRSLAVQRQEAIHKGKVEKAAELDREPQVKLGWKVVQMERRGVSSDRGNQLRQVRADNAQRKAEVVDIGQLRAQLVQRREEEAPPAAWKPSRRESWRRSRRCSAGRDRSIGKPRSKDGGIWHTREVPEVMNARALWEQDQRDPDANAWRETRKTIEWEAGQVARSAAAIEEWRQKHPIQALAVRTGLKEPSADLRRLEQTHAESIRFLEGNQHQLAELERAWLTKRPAYERRLEVEGEEIVKARRYVRVIEGNRDHFQKFWKSEDQALFQKRAHKHERTLDRGRGHGGSR